MLPIVRRFVEKLNRIVRIGGDTHVPPCPDRSVPTCCGGGYKLSKRGFQHVNDVGSGDRRVYKAILNSEAAISKLTTSTICR